MLMETSAAPAAPDTEATPLIERTRRSSRLGRVLMAGATAALALDGTRRLLSAPAPAAPSLAAAAETPAASKAPHVVIALLDDMGYNDAPWTSTDLGAAMPFARRLAADGVVLSNYYADQSCTPSRAALLTGRHAVELGVYSTVVWDSAWGLDENAKTLPALIEDARPGAYHKACVGKWDVGHSTAAYLPLARGFDTFTGMLGDMMTDYSTHMAEFTSSGPVYDLFEGDAPSYDYQNTYATDIWTSAATSAVAAAHEAAKGLLLYLSYNAIHTAITLPNHFEEDDEYKALVAPLDAGDYTEQRQLAAGALLVVDRSLETLFQTLDAAGMTDDTLLFFGSDNGGLTGFGGSNYPLRGEKLTLFEGGVRVPAFFWAGAAFPRLRATAGAAYGGIVHVSDVAPTLFGAAFGGYDAVSGLDLSGAVLAGDEDAKTRDELVYAATVADFSEDASWDSAGTSVVAAYRDGRYKLLTNAPWCDAATTDAMCQCACDGVRTYVFDLDADPTETTNLVYMKKLSAPIGGAALAEPRAARLAALLSQRSACGRARAMSRFKS